MTVAADCPGRLRKNLVRSEDGDSFVMTIENSDNIGRDVVTVVRRVCRRPVDVAAHSTLSSDLGFDSLQTLEFVAELEDRFGITVPIERVPQIQTVGEAVDCVRSLLTESARP